MKHQNVFFSIIFLLIISSCKTIQEKNIIPISLERCEDCIYFLDYHKYELNLGSTPISFKNYSHYKPLIIKWNTAEGISNSWNTKRHFYLRNNENDSLNMLVGYISQKRVPSWDSINKEEHIIEKEIYKIFTEDTYLDKLKLPYVKKGNYEILKQYFEGLVYNIPDSLMKRPKNYHEIDKREVLFKDDIRSYCTPFTSTTDSNCYTMTLNRESSDKDKAFNKGEKIYRLRDMAIYVSFSSNVPNYILQRDSTYTLQNIKELSSWENSTLNQYEEFSIELKEKIDVIRKNRGRVPFSVLLDSVEAYKRQFKKY
ncbi:hypothetical protein [Pontimicrobium sp. MEBiC06410]